MVLAHMNYLRFHLMVLMIACVTVLFVPAAYANTFYLRVTNEEVLVLDLSQRDRPTLTSYGSHEIPEQLIKDMEQSGVPSWKYMVFPKARMPSKARCYLINVANEERDGQEKEAGQGVLCLVPRGTVTFRAMGERPKPNVGGAVVCSGLVLAQTTCFEASVSKVKPIAGAR
jgi:hypothetical protein